MALDERLRTSADDSCNEMEERPSEKKYRRHNTYPEGTGLEGAFQGRTVIGSEDDGDREQYYARKRGSSHKKENTDYVEVLGHGF